MNITIRRVERLGYPTQYDADHHGDPIAAGFAFLEQLRAHLLREYPGAALFCEWEEDTPCQD